MPFRWNAREHAMLGGYALKWLLLATPVGAVVGAAVALFLWSLDLATRARWATDMPSGIPWLLFALPLAGMGVSWMYNTFGKSSEAGNNLIIDQIHCPGGGVPRRMAPLVLIGTVITHLFGGSAGREGTAVQMGGSIASGLGRQFKLTPADTRTILMAGVAAGFGAVFGTPLTGAVFAAEVLAVGRIGFEGIVPCLIASVVGDWTTTSLGIHHTHYFIGNVGQMGVLSDVPHLNLLLLAKVGIAAVAFGLGSVLFAEMAHSFGAIFKKALPKAIWRPAVGGVLVIILAYLVGPDYLGIGVTADPHFPDQVSILSSFKPGGAEALSWFWKTLFTTVTLSSGFKGGEVTPLFFIGAALGNTMAVLLNAPVALFAGLGFVAVFAGATNTPLACTIMGIELFGGQAELMHGGFVVYVATACFIAYLISGHSGIYLSQRIGVPKLSRLTLPPDATLRSARGSNESMSAIRLIELSRTCSALKKQAGNTFETLRRTIPVRLRRGVVVSGPTDGPAPHDASDTGAPTMPQPYTVSGSEIGQVRIYMTPRDRKSSRAIKKLFTRPLYQEIIDAAKADGILNAMAHHTHYGYSGGGAVQSDKHETPNDKLNLFVELIAHRDELERFCRKHGDLLADKVIVYKHIESWAIRPDDTLESTDLSPEDMAEEGTPTDTTK